MAIDNPRVQSLRLLAGELCLDFVNTVEDRTGQQQDDRIASFEDLITWGAHAGILTTREATQLLTGASEQPGRVQAILSGAIDLRESIHRVFLSITHDQTPPPSDLEQIRHAYRDAIDHALFAQGERGYEWSWDVADHGIIRWTIARSAVDLLTNGDLRRVKVCSNATGCGWLFYDRSKNASRRWCSMEGCGAREKMRRYLSKRK